ncbi:ARM repeat protein interacting with ABF2 [Vitis vinifera]|uniref:ARM repeat protein interacting with ABF2 n=1 Tax=Vitis vinifera TaxID=29760 RepID=A0A438KM17_VITVI|nr:ARM repeat protein interacting with ABF2 [Vitis vinifera]
MPPFFYAVARLDVQDKFHLLDLVNCYSHSSSTLHPEHQQLIVDNGALSHLVDLLKRHRDGSNSRAVNSVIRRAADAVTNLAHENSSIKTRVRMEGGIPPLVQLLEFADTKVQRAAAGALRTLAFKNDENKNQIVECNALPTLILMLRSEDAAIHYEAVGVIGNLVHSSPNIKKEVLLAGALQPVIGLLRYERILNSCHYYGVFALVVSLMSVHAALRAKGRQLCYLDNLLQLIQIARWSHVLVYVHIAQRGAVRPLIEMLQSADVQLREMSAFALGRLAQEIKGHSETSLENEDARQCTGNSLGWIPKPCKCHPVRKALAGAITFCIYPKFAHCDVCIHLLAVVIYGFKEKFLFFQDTHNQAGIAHNGGLVPLLKLLDSKNGSLQHNAAFALYGLADNEDNVSDFIKVGGVQKLQDGEFIVQATKDCVAKTLKRLEEKIHGRVLNHLLYLMRVSEKAVQRRVALALAHLCSADDQRTIFIDNNGMPFFFSNIKYNQIGVASWLLGSSSPKQQLDGSVALYKLANKAMTLSPVDAAPPSPTPQVSILSKAGDMKYTGKLGKMLLTSVDYRPLREMPAVVRMRAMPVLTCAKFPIQGYTGKKASIGSCDDKQFLLQVYLGEQYVNSATLSDVTFLVGGRRFYAHRIAFWHLQMHSVQCLMVVIG